MCMFHYLYDTSECYIRFNSHNILFIMGRDDVYDGEWVVTVEGVHYQQKYFIQRK